MQHITDKEINILALYNQSKNSKAGGIVMFSGDVRDFNKNKEVLYIDYEAYIPMAEKNIAEIVMQAKLKWKLQDAFCLHRIGKVAIKETAVLVITSSMHRKEAYEANRYIIDRVKSEAPIWKHEFYADGTSEWGNNCECSTSHHHH